MSNKQLYIGINGFAGSGKDTVAKMLKTILSKDWPDLESCKTYYKSVYTNPTISATYNAKDVGESKTSPVMCIAYADQLKSICATIFGIPVSRFYMNKSTAWICINKDFTYTEIQPDTGQILTAEEYYYGLSEFEHSPNKYWMSLREILVYVGTYILQEINKSIFVNIVRNKIKEMASMNANLKYVIVTDNRFLHELDYIRKNNGITISVVRDSVKQLDNIAEHDLDYEVNYDYIIENNDGYDELFEKIWNIVHENVIFKNEVIDLYTRDNINNYLRLVDSNSEFDKYLLCTPMKIQNIYHSDGEISMINPAGGPTICVSDKIETSDDDSFIVPDRIIFNEEIDKFEIEVDK